MLIIILYSFVRFEGILSDLNHAFLDLSSFQPCCDPFSLQPFRPRPISGLHGQVSKADVEARIGPKRQPAAMHCLFVVICYYSLPPPFKLLVLAAKAFTQLFVAADMNKMKEGSLLLLLRVHSKSQSLPFSRVTC